MTADPIVVQQMRRFYDHDERMRRREVQRKLAVKRWNAVQGTLKLNAVSWPPYDESASE